MIPELLLTDVVGSLQYLEHLIDKRIKIKKELADKIGSLLHGYSSSTFTQIHYAEKLLTLIGNLIDLNGEEGIMMFCSSAPFVDSLVCLIDMFKGRLINYSPTLSNRFSFTSHLCYELALFIMLAMVEKSVLIKIFLKTITHELLMKLIKSYGSIMPEDYMYITQEMALEIVGRICHYYHKADQSVYESILKLIPKQVAVAMKTPDIGIVGLLRDMRGVLTDINQHNPYIKSIPIEKFTIVTPWQPNNPDKVFKTSGYLDMCKECISFNLVEEELLVRLPYRGITTIHFATQTCTLQMVVLPCPDKVLELLTDGERSPTNECPLMTFFFSGGMEAVMMAKDILTQRLDELVPTQPDNTKASVVSSRMLPVPPPRTGVTPAVPLLVPPVVPPATTPVKATKGGKKGAKGAQKAEIVSPGAESAKTKGTAATGSGVTDNISVSSVSSPDMTPHHSTAAAVNKSDEVAVVSAPADPSAGINNADRDSLLSHFDEAAKKPVVVIARGRGRSVGSAVETNKDRVFVAPKVMPKSVAGKKGARAKTVAAAAAAADLEPVPEEVPFEHETSADLEPVTDQLVEQPAEQPTSGTKRKFGTVTTSAEKTTLATPLAEKENVLSAKKTPVRGQVKPASGSAKLVAPHQSTDIAVDDLPGPDTFVKPVGKRQKKDSNVNSAAKEKLNAGAAAHQTPEKTPKKTAPNQSEFTTPGVQDMDWVDNHSVAGSACMSVHTANTANSKRKYGKQPNSSVLESEPLPKLNFEIYEDTAEDVAASAKKKRMETESNKADPWDVLGSRSSVPKAQSEGLVSPLRMTASAMAAHNKRLEQEKNLAAKNAHLSAAQQKVKRGAKDSEKTAKAPPAPASLVADSASEIASVKDIKLKIKAVPAHAAPSSSKGKSAAASKPAPVPATVTDAPKTTRSSGGGVAVDKVSTNPKQSAAKETVTSVASPVASAKKGSTAASVKEVGVQKGKAADKQGQIREQRQKEENYGYESPAQQSKVPEKVKDTKVSSAPIAPTERIKSLKASAKDVAHGVRDAVGNPGAGGDDDGEYWAHDAPEDFRGSEAEDHDTIETATSAPVAKTAKTGNEVESAAPSRSKAPPLLAATNTTAGAPPKLAVDTGAVKSWRDVPSALGQRSGAFSLKEVPLPVEPGAKTNASTLNLHRELSTHAHKYAANSNTAAGGKSSSSATASAAAVAHSEADAYKEPQRRSTPGRKNKGFYSEQALSVASTPYTPGSEEQQEYNSELDSGEDDAGNKHRNVSDAGSSDDDHIISILLAEIVAMQKARAARKRDRMLQTVTSTALSQISCYLNQCKEYADHSATTIDIAIHSKLQAICLEADSVCEDMARDVADCKKQTEAADALYRQLELETSAFNTEVTGVCAQYAKEERETKAELANMKAAVLDSVRKTIASRYSEREPGRKMEKSKLLRALKEL